MSEADESVSQLKTASRGYSELIFQQTAMVEETMRTAASVSSRVRSGGAGIETSLQTINISFDEISKLSAELGSLSETLEQETLRYHTNDENPADTEPDSTPEAEAGLENIATADVDRTTD